MATTTKARPAPKKKPVRGGSGRRSGLLTWGTIGVILVVIVAIVIVIVTKSSPNVSDTFVKTPTAVVDDLTAVPMSVFNTVGVTAPRVQVSDPIVLTGQPPLDWTLDGLKKPTLLYIGAEYCPYCAAERWPLIVALSRFGTFTNLGDMQSSSIDKFPSTQTFTLWKATYTSKYFNFFHVEGYSAVIDDSSPTGYAVLQTPTAAELADETTYDSSTYVPGLPEGGSIPFISFNNKILIVGASYTPQTLAGSSRAQIAGSLASPSNYVGQGIIATANLISASVCSMDAQQPSSVCQSPGVLAADSSMKIKS
jgi:hypothetical protein